MMSCMPWYFTNCNSKVFMLAKKKRKKSTVQESVLLMAILVTKCTMPPMSKEKTMKCIYFPLKKENGLKRFAWLIAASKK